MSSYIVRVELHHETDYQKLHDAMQARGMKRFITASDGNVYRTPTGIYNVQSTTSSQNDVYNATKAAAKAAGHLDPAILVVESVSCLWSGLERATEYEVRKAG